MDAEIVPLGILSPGTVSSTLPYTLIPGGTTRDADGLDNEAPDHCLVAVSPCKRLVVLLLGRTAQFFSVGGKHPSGSLGVLYKTTYEGLLPVVLEADPLPPTPTAVAVFPVVLRGGKMQTENVVVAGFSDGGLRFYKSDGQLVFSHTLHKEAVRKISTSVPVRHGTRTIKQDELLVLYQSVLCVVSGPSVLQCVRECFNRNLMTEGAEAPSLPSLSHRKWSLQQQTETCDVVSLVSCAVPLFDQLAELSKVKGPDANPRSIAPYDRKLISVGTQPMMALYNVSKDAGTIHMTEMFSAMASAMTSAVMSKISSWWGGKSATTAQAPQRQPQRVENTLSLSMSCNLPDPTRRVTAAWLSPCGHLLVTADDYGRVLLLDTLEFVVLRMWKGYRNAQCGWIQVGEEDAPGGDGRERGGTEVEQEAVTLGGRGSARSALCLCIFAARRGIVELWPVQDGPKIATFQVGKACRLLPSHSVVFGEPQGDSLLKGTDVMLITAEGQLVELSVPQHLLLRSGRSHSRDLLLLRKLPHAITTGDTDLVMTACDTLQSSRIIVKCVDVLIRECPNSSIPLHFVAQMISKVLGRLSQGPATPAMGQLRAHLMKLRQLVALFVFLQDVSRRHGEERHFNDLMREKLVDKCSIPPAASGSLTTTLNSYFKSLASQTLSTPKPLSLREFVNCFSTSSYKGPDLQLPKVSEGTNKTQGEEVEGSSLEVKSAMEEKQGSTTVEPVRLHPKLSGDSLVRLGSMLFKSIVCHNCKHDALHGMFQGSGLQGSDLMTALVAAWLSKQMSPGHSPFGSLEGVREALTAVLRVGDNPGLQWSIVSQCCRESTHFGHALLLAVTAYSFSRGEAEDTTRQMKDSAVQRTLEYWEAVSEEDDDWLHLLQELEFFTRFTLLTGSEYVILFPVLPVVKLHPNGSLDMEHIAPVVKMEEGGREALPLTVALCKQSGMEVVCHAVASWAVSMRVNPCLLEIMDSYKEDIEKQLTPAEQSLVPKLRHLAQCSPVAMGIDDLHVKCVWQACAHWQSDLMGSETKERIQGQAVLLELECALQHLLHITSPQLMMAAGHLMWVVVFHPQIRDIIELVKKPGNLTPCDPLIVTMARQLMGVLVQLCATQLDVQVHAECETILDNTKVDLSTLLLKANSLNQKTVELHYSVLLCLELVTTLHLAPIRLFSVFDVWVRECFGSNLEEELVQRKGRSPAAMRHQQLKFLAKALTALITAPPKAHPSPYLKPRAMQQNAELSQVLLNSWSDLVYHAAELMVPLVADETKVTHVCLLYAAGLDQTAEEVLRVVPGSKMLTERLIQAAGQRVGRLLSKEAQSSRKAMALAQISPQVLEWISQQSSQMGNEGFPVQAPTWGTSRNLLNTISNTCELTTHQQTYLQSLHALVAQFTAAQS